MAQLGIIRQTAGLLQVDVIEGSDTHTLTFSLTDFDRMSEATAQVVARPIDKASIDRLNKLHPKLRPEAMAAYAQVNAALTGRAICRITQGLRTIAEQDALYAQGRTKPGAKVTNAKGGQSYHNYGLAVDFCLIVDGKEVSWDMTKDYDADRLADWSEVVRIFKARGWEWGGNWRTSKDYPHFQWTYGKTESQLFTLYKAGKVDKEGYAII